MQNNQLIYSRQTPNVIAGTSLQGYTTPVTYAELVSTFGQPNIMDDFDKVTHLWVLNIEGVTATIYDYKDNLKSDKPAEWHIGGKQKVAERLVNQIIKENRYTPTDLLERAEQGNSGLTLEEQIAEEL